MFSSTSAAASVVAAAAAYTRFMERQASKRRSIYDVASTLFLPALTQSSTTFPTHFAAAADPVAASWLRSLEWSEAGASRS